MSNKARQNWEINQKVKIGFLTLKVTAFDSEEGIYNLTSLDGIKEYDFKPYEGLRRLNAPISL